MSLSDVFGKEVDLTRYFDAERIANPSYYPNNTVLVETQGTKVIVDPGDRGRLLSVYGFKPPSDQPAPPTLADQLNEVGVKPPDIDSVVITHLHYDHFAGLTRKEGDNTVPSFPKAKHMIPRRDWETPDISEARKKGDKDVAETLGVVEGAGLLNLVDGEKDLGGGITILPFPGESPGHQILSVKSNGAACYCTGDLYHLKEEVVHPELVPPWADVKTLERSRVLFARQASDESALVFPGHMRPGKIGIKRDATAWSEV